MNLENLHQAFLKSKGINTDTRTLNKGQFFVALSGDNFDGNSYVPQALSIGAAHIICSDSSYEGNSNVTVVKDTLIALQELALYHRRTLDIPIVALTGSNGKTTTKELIISVLSTKYNVVGTKGNLNNHIGVPLTLLSFNHQTEIGIVEMGANHLKEIEALCLIAQPNYGLITNFGKAHLEGFGSLEGVKKGKSELYEFLKKNNGRVIARKEDPEQVERTESMNRRLTPTFQIISQQPLELKWEDQNFRTDLTGNYNVANMELAAAVGLEMEVSKEDIIKGLCSYQSSNNRSQIIRKENLTIIKDAYNANPTSMKAALENLALQDGYKVAVLGDMFELGNYAAEEHQAIADHASRLKIDQIILIGKNFYGINPSQQTTFQNFTDFK